jgi:hypothetical protein
MATDVYGVTITSNSGSLVTGVFKFDGRLKSGQGADFTYVTDPAWKPPQDPAWHVIVNRSRNGTDSVIRRNMKECEQKNIITARLKAQLDDMLSDSTAHNWGGAGEDPAAHTWTGAGADESADPVEEYGVETERELAAPKPLTATVQKVIDDTRKSERPSRYHDLAAKNVSTQQATTEDLLEIPDFLKRT